MLTAAACGTEQAPTDRAELESKVPPSVVSDVASGKSRDILVELSDDVAFDPAAMAAGGPQATELRALQTATYEDLKAEVLGAVGEGLEVRAELAHLPVMSVRVSSIDALAELAALPDVVRVSEDVAYKLAPANETVRGSELQAALSASSRRDGVIAMLDSGVDAAACGTCKVVASAELADDDGSADAQGHGTAIAGRLAALIPGAGLASLDVVGDDGMIHTSALLAGIDWSIEHLDSKKIAALRFGLADETAIASGVLGTSVRVADRTGLVPVVAPATMRAMRTAWENGISLSASGFVPDSLFAMPTGGTVSIAAAATYTKSTLVILTLGATGATEMCVSNTTACTAWEAYSTSKAFSLSSGNGTKTVRAWFGDGAGNRTAAAVSDTIILDATKPIAGTVLAVPDLTSPDDTVVVSWSGFSDANTGIADYKVLRHTVLPTSCTDSAATVVSASTTATTLVDDNAAAGLTTGTTYQYRVCANDNAGNFATSTGSGTPASQRVAPMAGSVQIVQAGTTTEIATSKVTAVKLVLAATPQGSATMTKMCISTTPICTFTASSPAYSTAHNLTLATGTGLKTIYVWFKDSDGNVTPAPYVDTVLLDITKPLDGMLTSKVAAGNVTLNWAGTTDANSGLASFTVKRGLSTAPPASGCTTGTAVGSAGLDVTRTDTGPAAGTYVYRVCATDVAGNTSIGVVKTVVVP